MVRLRLGCINLVLLTRGPPRGGPPWRAGQRAHATGLDTIADCDPAEKPLWMYFLTPNHLDTLAAYALTHASPPCIGDETLAPWVICSGAGRSLPGL